MLFKLSKQIDGDWSGDRDDLQFSVADDLWQRITNDNHGCPGKTCANYEFCPFVKSRIKMRAANVIVVNHDFLLTSLKAESKALPPASDCIFVFDECHHLPEIAVRRSAVSHSLRGAISWIEKLGAANAKTLLTTKDKVGSDKLESSLRILSRSLAELLNSIEHSNLFQDKPVYRYPHGVLDEGMTMFAGEISKASASALTAAQEIMAFIEELRKHDLYDKVSQAFAVFLPVRSVGVMGDGRRYDFVVALRAVETVDFMTARWARLPYEFLENVSLRIINEVKGISRVTYDISGKPPATIEWE